MKPWFVRLAIATLALALLATLALAWLLGSAAGRDFALARLAAALPGVEVGWRSAEGRLAGPLVLHGLRVEGGDYTFELERLALELDLWPLWRGRLVITGLDLEAGRLRRLPAPEPDAAGWRWPEDLPAIELPLAIELRRLTVNDLALVRVTPDGEHALLHLATASGRARIGPDRLVLEALELDSDRGRLTLNGRWQNGRDPAIEVTARYRPRHPGGRDSELRLHALAGRGRLAVDLDGRAPGPLRLDLRIEAPARDPRWTLAIEAEDLRPDTLWPGAGGGRYAGRIAARGHGGVAEAEGELDLDGVAVRLEPSHLSLAERRLDLEALRLGLLEGRLVATGTVELAAPPRFELDLEAEALRWGGDEGSGLPQARGRLSGSAEAWRLEAEGTLEGRGERAEFALAAEGGAERARIETLSLVAPLGRARATGELAWRPTLAWQAEVELDRFDPATLLPAWPGRVSGRLDSRGRWPEVAGRTPEVDATLQGLAGQVRGRALSGEGEFTLREGRGRVRLDLALGASRLHAEGRIAPDLDLGMHLAPLNLDDLLPAATGRLQGRLHLRGDPGRPALEAALAGRDIAVSGLEAKTLSLRGHLPERGEGSMGLALSALRLGAIPVAEAVLTADGGMDDLLLDLELADPKWSLAARSRVTAVAEGWRGRLQQLTLRPPEPAAGGGLRPATESWTLDRPADWTLAADRYRLDATCLAHASGQLCLEADWPGRLDASGRDLPLALAGPWLNRGAAATGREPIRVEGRLAFDFELRPTASSLDGALSLRSGPARVVLPAHAEGERALLNLLGLELEAGLSGDRVDATLVVRRADEGGIEARVATGLGPDAPIDGSVELDLRDLAWLELFAPDLAQPRGRLRGRLDLGGRRDAPELTGRAELLEFAAELPVLGLNLRESSLAATGTGPERLELSGRLDSGEGELALRGEMALDGRQPWLRLNLEGERFLAVDNPELRLLASPTLEVTLADTGIALRGELDIPEARVALERLERSVGASPDVVVLDPAHERERRRLPLEADLRVTLGRRVALSGYGLDGRLAGRLRIRQRPGGEALASGSLDLGGRYTAFDTELEITRGRLAYANSPLDSPVLDLRAERRFDGQMVGVQVRGDPRDPRTSLISEPALDSSQTLSWLVLGRPLRTASGAEGERLGAAAMALGAGGNLLAQQLGHRIGLELGVEDSQALGGSAFTVGKYLSPRLLLSYGVSLLGNGQVVGLSYRLHENLEVEVESGQEQSAALKWRHER